MGIFDQYDFGTGRMAPVSPMLAMPASPVSNTFAAPAGVDAAMQGMGAYGQSNLQVQGGLNTQPQGMFSSLSSYLPDFMKDWTITQTRDINGNVSGGQYGALLGAMGSIGNMYMGMKQYGLAKDQLAFSKDAFAKNYAAQKDATNRQYQDRFAARKASNPGAYGDYTPVIS
jgi:hypothetical protein